MSLLYDMGVGVFCSCYLLGKLLLSSVTHLLQVVLKNDNKQSPPKKQNKETSQPVIIIMILKLIKK